MPIKVIEMLTMLHSFIVIAKRQFLCMQLCTAVPVNADILPSLQALHLETSPPAMQKVPSHKHNGSPTCPGGFSAGVPNQPQGTQS